jgi:hypothetical protein
MIHNTPYQDLIAVRDITQKFLDSFKKERGFYPKTKPGVFFNSKAVGLQVEGFQDSLVFRAHSRLWKWKSQLELTPEFYSQFEINLVREVLEEVSISKIEVLKQPEAIARAFRFRLNLI